MSPADPDRVADVLRAATKQPQAVDTRTQKVTIRTRRGNLYVGPHGRIEGLWRLCQRELRTAKQVRGMCGFSTRASLIRWRHDKTDPFPKPVWVAKDELVELWSRTEVEEWLERTVHRRQPRP